MRKASDHLYRLIKSLTKTEKRYFKLFTELQKQQDNKPKSYLVLFDVLDKMEEFNEQETKAVMKEHLTGKATQWAEMKKYLYQAILKSLRFYHEQGSIESRLNAQFQEASILEKRGLYDQCSKVLEQLKKQALLYEQHTLLISILRKQVMLAFDAKTNGLENTINEYYDNIRSGMDGLTAEVNYEQLTHQLFSLIRHQGGIRESEEEMNTKIDQIADSTLFEDKKNAITFRSAYLYYYSKVIYYQLRKDAAKAFENMHALIKVWEDNPGMIKGFPKQYKIYLTNYISFCIALGKNKEVPTYLKKIKDIQSKSYDERGEDLQNVYYLELLYYMNLFQPKAALKVIPEIERILKEYKSKINKSREITFYYNITILYFMVEDYINALAWSMNITVEKEKSDLRKDMKLFARIVQLIFHYEMENNKILEQMYLSTYRTLHRTGKLYRYEKIMLQHIRKLMNAANKREKMEIFEKFKVEMEKLAKEISISSRVGMGEVLAWLDSKLQKRAIITILRERNLPKDR